MSFGAVLLAGGASHRMGRDKAALAWGGETLLQHQAQTLRRTGAHPLLLSQRRDQVQPLDGFQVVVDTFVHAGPAAGLADAWRETSSQVLLTLAIDLPFLPADYLHELAVGAVQQGRSVVPVHGGRYEPLAAAWDRSCLVAFADPAGRSLQAICAVLAKMELLTVREVTNGEARLFENVNTPEDYRRAGAGVTPAS